MLGCHRFWKRDRVNF